MRITAEQLIAGYPALEVREFVRRYRLTEFSAETAQHFLAVSPRVAASFIKKLGDLGFIEATGKSDKRKRQTNACFAAQAAGVSSATRWTDAFVSPGRTSAR